MKYFKSDIEKSAAWTEMIEDEQNMSSPRFMNDPALEKLTSALKEVEANRPLAPGKNPDSTAKYIL